MTVNETQKLGKTLGGQSTKEDQLSQQISPDESQAQDQMAGVLNVRLQPSLTVYSYTLPNAFVMDHPRLGYLDLEVPVPEGYKPIVYLEDLDDIRTDTSSNYWLTRDLDFAEDSSYADPETNKPLWTTGDGFTKLPTFTGVFNGNFYTIKNLQILNGGSDTGLFSTLSGTVRNLKLENPTISGAGSVGTIAGGLINAIIENVKIINTTVTSTGWRNGGLAGRRSSGGVSIRRCIVTGSVSGTRMQGGIGGDFNVSTNSISDCIVNVTVTGPESGQIAGRGGFVVSTHRVICLGTGELIGGMSGPDATCFYNSDITSSTTGTGKTTAELQTLSTYIDAGYGIATLAEHNKQESPNPWVYEDNLYPYLFVDIAEHEDVGGADPLPFNYGYVTNLVTIPITMPLKMGVERQLIYDSEAE